MRKLTATALTTALALGLASAAMAQSPTPLAPGAANPSGNSAAPSSGGMYSGAGTSSSSAATINSPSQAKDKLELNGYSNVQAVQKSGAGFTATAMKDGKQVHVAVDGHGNIETR